MSTSDDDLYATEFEEWIAEEFTRTGAFTAIVVLVSIGETTVTPLCSTYFNVIGDEVDWSEIVVMFEGAGTNWDGASFYPIVANHGGPVDNPTARQKVQELEDRLNDDRLVLNDGHFFDKWGRGMRIDEVLQ